MPAFSNEGVLRDFDTFQKLDENIQATVLQLLREDRLNNCGGFKRPPNAWLIFRSDALAAPEASALPQSELTVRCKTQWATLSTHQKMELQSRAQLAYNELLEFFPDYCYKPMPAAEKARWRRLSPTQRKEFWLASAVRIAERIVSREGSWDGFLRFDQWMMNGNGVTAQSPSNSSSARIGLTTTSDTRPTRTPSPRVNLHHSRPRFQQEMRTDSGSPSGSTSTSSIHKLAHPYKRALYNRAYTRQALRHKDAEATSPPEWLSGVLVAIGPHEPGDKPRRLVLSMFQRKGPVIWVEEEIEDGIPEEVLQTLSQTQPNETSPDLIILRGYSNPRIPPSINEHGELLVPRLKHVAQHHEYMAAYHTATETGLRLLWPPVSALGPQSPPGDIEHPNILDPSVSTERISEAIMPSAEGLPLITLATPPNHHSYTTSPCSVTDPMYTAPLDGAGRTDDAIGRIPISQTQPYQLDSSVQTAQAGDFGSICAFDTAEQDHFGARPSTQHDPSVSPFDTSADMVWDSSFASTVGAQIV